MRQCIHKQSNNVLIHHYSRIWLILPQLHFLFRTCLRGAVMFIFEVVAGVGVSQSAACREVFLTFLLLWISKRSWRSLLDLLIDGLQLFLQHDGQGLHIRLSAGWQKLGAKPSLPVVLIVWASHIHAWLEPSPNQSVIPIWVLHTQSKTGWFTTQRTSDPICKYQSFNIKLSL